MGLRMHPDGVAALVAVIVADLDMKEAGFSGKDAVLLKALLDRRLNQVMLLAKAYYAIHPCDFDNSSDWREEVPRNHRQNLARLDRRNLF